MIVLGEQSLFPGAAIATALTDRGMTFGQLMAGDTGEQVGSLPYIIDALTKQGAHGSFLGRIDVGGRDQVGSQQVSEFFAVDAIVLIFTTVNGFEVERVGEDEVQVGLETGI